MIRAVIDFPAKRPALLVNLMRLEVASIPRRFLMPSRFVSCHIVVGICLLVSVCHLRAASATPATAPVEVFTSITRIKADQTSAVSHSARVEGVVVWVGDRSDFFLHDGQMGIHVRESEAGRKLRPGDRIRVAGQILEGTFAPSIEPIRIDVLGTESLPEPKPASFNVVASGAMDGQWLEISGVVWSVSYQDDPSPITVINLSVDGQRLRVLVNYPPKIDGRSLIDAEVKVCGVATGRFNPQRQLVEPVIRVTDLSSLKLVRPAPADPFALPRVPLNRLLGFSLDAANPHQVRVAGRVTRRISSTTFFICEETLGLKIELLSPLTVKAGDTVEAVGFASMENGAAVMQSAVCRVVSAGAPLPPARPTSTELFDGSNNSNLVTVKARLVDWIRDPQGITLILQSGDRLIKGLLPPTAGLESLPEKNSVVDVTGICVVSDVEDIWLYSPRSVRLLLTSLDDIKVLERPAWWTAERLWRVLAIALAVLIAGVAWVWSLRRQIKRKRAVIEQQSRHAAVLEERSRIARDLHDTLEQGLTGLSLQLKAVEMDIKDAPERAAETLNESRRMLRQSRALAHDAIREMRTDEVAPRYETLVSGLRRIVAMWKRFGVLTVEMAVTGSERPVLRYVEQALVYVAAEAITNAVKHGQATSIQIDLQYGDAQVILRISDNGKGFDAERASLSDSNSFGLLGMRERVKAIGGRIEIRSRPGAGTTVEIEAPVSADSTAGRRAPDIDSDGKVTPISGL